MAKLHVFISTARFRSFQEIRSFIDQTYTEDGDGVPSQFMRDVALTDYEPDAIEAIHQAAPMPLAELLAGASYADQWLPALAKSAGHRLADSAICLFAPNQVRHPHGSPLEYVGAYDYATR